MWVRLLHRDFEIARLGQVEIVWEFVLDGSSAWLVRNRWCFVLITPGLRPLRNHEILENIWKDHPLDIFW
jgi:hypothetical protein